MQLGASMVRTPTRPDCVPSNLLHSLPPISLDSRLSPQWEYPRVRVVYGSGVESDRATGDDAQGDSFSHLDADHTEDTESPTLM